MYKKTQCKKTTRKMSQKYEFITKSDTLKFLQGNLTKSKIEPIYDFTVEKWEENKNVIIKEISKKFQTKIIVRSSAIGEDSINLSQAGSYTSILNVNPKKNNEIKNAIYKVVKSYHKKGNQYKNNLVLIQKQTTKIISSGVVFTKENKRGLPYFIINYDEGENTESVTKGLSRNTLKIFRGTEKEKIPKKWVKLIHAIQEIEQITGRDNLDIEFGITKDSITIFQVRPITTIQHPSINANRLKNKIQINKKNFRKSQQDKNYRINHTYFSDMSDWNPAEIIGNNPNPLDYSLYEYLIMKDAWNLGRKKIGYSLIKENLMKKFGTKPYVDLRASFHSFIPDNISKKLKKKILKYYLQKIREEPHLHDKVEFKILFSCYDFSLKTRLEDLKNYNFSNQEIKEIKSNILEFTNNILTNYHNIISEADESLLKMEKNRKEIVLKINSESKFNDYLNAVESLLKDCRRYGTIQFSTMARLAFISSILLKSMVENQIIDQKMVDAIMTSINSPLTKFKEDFQQYSEGHISKEDFLMNYGHLRPGTYDITSKRYDSSKEFLTNLKFSEKKSKTHSIIAIQNIEKKFRNNNELKIQYTDFLNFVKTTLRKREELKFEFTKNLSDALELLARGGKELGFLRSEIKYLEINDFLKKKNNSKKEIISFWTKKILKQKNKKHIDEKLILPSIIFDEKDFEIITQHIDMPNYITRKTTTGEIVQLNNLENIPNLNDKIIVLENADPGYDWIFTKNPKGLITKYGGVASHMSIRCAEMALPAAIGCGNLIFEQLNTASKITLDCKNNQIIILENKENNPYIEERKALKSLGYIR